MWVGQEEHTDMDVIATNLRVFFRNRDQHHVLANVASKKSPLFFLVWFCFFSPVQVL